jgi:hypothetical protein
VSQPLDREHQCQALGEIDTAAGEFWVENPFQMPRLGHNLSAYEENCLFINAGGSRFLDASFASRANINSDSRSVVAGDFDRDGAIDLLVGSVGGGPLRLFLNRFPATGRKVRLELEGRASNRAGIGARVTAQVGPRRIVRDLFPANGFMGQSPSEWLLGVGDATMIDRLTIRWPSGETQSFENVRTEQRIQIREGDSAYRSVSL